MLQLICVSIILAAAVAQPAREGCCTPMQWEGYEDATVGFAGTQGHEAMLEGMRLHVDHTGKRVAAHSYQYFEISGHLRNFSVIDNFAMKKRAFIENGTCHVSDLTETMLPNCIPLEHGHYGVYHIGAGENTLEVDAWMVPTTRAREEIHMRTIRLSTEGCVPYQRRHIFIPGPEEEGHPAFASFHSFNRITVGIEDDSVFNTPDECKTVDHIELPLAFEEAMRAFHA